MIGFEDLSRIDGEGEISTIGINGESIDFLFKYGKVKNETYGLVGITFKVFTKEMNIYSAFGADLIEYEDGLKVVMIGHDDIVEYMNKNIPEYLIPKIADTLNKTIYSSSSIDKYKSYPAEGRVKNATKYWERMKLLFPKNVSFDELKGIYFYMPDSP